MKSSGRVAVWVILRTTIALTAWALWSNTAGHKGKPLWTPPKPFHWNYSRFREAERARLRTG